MIHYVVEAVDRGAPVLTQEIQIREGESPDELGERRHGFGHELIVKATALLVEDRICMTEGSATG